MILARHTTQESVLDHLRDMILSRQLKPGDRLVQEELAEEFGVSRTPVREALHQQRFVTCCPIRRESSLLPEHRQLQPWP